MQFFDTLTVFTISGILAIFVLYVIVVYKKGWLRRDSKESEVRYLCPNPDCRRVFNEPVWFTDLSKSPPESYQSCPHCSADLRNYPSPSVKLSHSYESTVEPKPSFKGFRESSERVHDPQKETVTNETETTKEALKSTFQSNASKSSEKAPNLQKPKTLSKTPEIGKTILKRPIEPPKKHGEKKNMGGSRTCSNFLGYLRTLPKNGPIPDECFSCHQLVECLTGTKEVLAS